MKPATLLFLEIEASSLDPGSHPIELGRCDEDGNGEAHLIHPARHWKMWSAASEGVHGITRQQLQAEGQPTKEVPRRAALTFAPRRAVVPSDFAPADEVWLGRLFAAGGIATRPQLLDLRHGIRDIGLVTLLQSGAPMAAVSDHASSRPATAMAACEDFAVGPSGPCRSECPGIRTLQEAATPGLPHGWRASAWLRRRVAAHGRFFGRSSR